MKTPTRSHTVSANTPAPKLGPGEYLPDGIFQKPEDLPQPKIIKERRGTPSEPCPQCRRPAARHRRYSRRLYDLGDLRSGRPCILEITYSQHYCSACRRYFNQDLSDLAAPKSLYTHRVQGLAVRLVIEDGLPFLADLSRAVLSAVAQMRKALEGRKPKVGRGRPTASTRKLVQQRQRLEQKISDLFTHRYLFVQRHLTPSEQATLHQTTRELPHLRALREIMDEVYRLFDRRCRTETALTKLRRLRQRSHRFTQLGHTLKALGSANVDKALTFLDDRLLPATSNAVERSNRRYRKMQKTIYRVQTQAQIIGRLALDMLRDTFAQNRLATLQLLHQLRALSCSTLTQ